ncbi:MCE family protein [Microvirga sp. STR05]|uniref:MCE family protein n=1 Tax=Hymenobacter duratus TaxID=2771356 RepID=A0ABR8JLQ2_9BACT|nr:MlaD family protein [Hymenobacter duratus]MBD2716523.1 MCE family protein [Hymenobacter duratus]MBR7951438.1 MCE family protein [Microvirga sp. STR05]
MPAERTASNHIRLGLFVLAGLGFLLVTLFLLGRKQNMFGDRLQLQADFRNVSGLLTGNNVRLAGIDVGTVRRIRILNDSTVRVTMDLNRDVQPFLRKNTVASIGTDGLVGNTIVNLTGTPAPAPPVEPGDVLRTTTPLALNDMLSTFDVSNRNLVGITQDLRQITSKLNHSDAFWQLLNDPQLTTSIRRTMQHAEAATSQLGQASADIRLLTHGIRAGRGPAGYLLTDTAFAGQLRHASRQLATTSDTLAATLAGLQKQTQTPNGPLHTLLADTALSQQLRQSMRHVEQGTADFSQTMEALQHNFLVRGYLRRQQKKQQPLPQHP